MAVLQVQLILAEQLPWWTRIFYGLTAHEIGTVMLQCFAAFLLVFDQCTVSFSQLAEMGSFAHFQFGASSKPIPQPSPDELANLQIASLLQEEAETLEQARRQLQLLVSATAQLENKVASDCAPFLEKSQESNTSQAPSKPKSVGPVEAS